jgi:hypothetical protein
MKKMLIMLPFKKRKEKKYACMHAFECRRYIYIYICINLGREKWELGWEGMIGRLESWEDRDRR